MEVLLDRYRDAVLPEGYTVIDTEVDFLRHADNTNSLLIRGSDLCNWAETFYHGREIPCRETSSAVRELTMACPMLSREQAMEVFALLGGEYDQLAKPVNSLDVLQALYPQRMWIEAPSIEHGATWLVWRATQTLSTAVLPLLAIVISRWQAQAVGSEQILYTVTDSKSAMHLLLVWLGTLEDCKQLQLGDFPLEIPEILLKEVRKSIRQELVSTHGRTVKALLARCSAQKVKLIIGELATDYFKKHSADLTDDLLKAMSAYLNREQQRALSRFVPPAQPISVPKDPSEVKQWFKANYLPYRLWQEQFGDSKAQQMVQVAAREFALWYLDQYAKGLVGGSLASHLSFSQSAKLATQNSAYATLMIVLDGLQVSDAQYVIHALQNVTTRLTITLDELAFAPLPTVTEFCKDALFKGTSPVNAPQYKPLGEILPENRSPTESLQRAQPGQLYLWRVQEPDATYHMRNRFQTLRREVESQLDGIANKIVDIITEVMPDTQLRVVITTDHGRLLANSQRLLSVPDGMESHGRAAWGASRERVFPAAGYLIEGEEVVYLHRDRFCLSSDVALSLTESAFHTNDNRTGSELYAHGGIYPEEVIIPWVVMIRDLQRPEIKIHLSGKGRAKTPGQLHLRVTNLSELQIDLVGVTLNLANKQKVILEVNLKCPAIYESTYLFDWSVWPTSEEIQNMNAQVEIQLPGGRQFVVDASIELESEEMYRKDQSILEGLD